MDNTLWWPLVAAFHAVLFLVLLCGRRTDHPWLLPCFGVIWATDLVALALMPSGYGGLDLLASWSGHGLCRGAVFFVSYVAWLSFWVVPAMTAERLRCGRLRWLWWPVLVTAAVALAATTWAIQVGAADRAHLLGVLHYGVEPLLLGLTLYHVVRYLGRCLRGARSIDLLALALMLEITNLSLKLLFALRPSLSVDQSFSALFHVVCLVGFFCYYAVDKVRARGASPTPS